MKVVILAGGFGTRLSEETEFKPKPMVEIGNKPILWHIMKVYSSFGINDFIVCCGYKGFIIKEYFANYLLHMSDVTFSLEEDKMILHQTKVEPWNITLVDTGEKTNTAGRLKRVKRYLEGEENFLFTYGDGLGDININELLSVHKKHNRIATVTAAQIPGRYGAIKIGVDDGVLSFQEKPDDEGGWISAGFFVLSQKVFDFIKDDTSIFENETLPKLAEISQLSVYKHNGFWKPMDTLRDKISLNSMWNAGTARWKLWND